MSQLTSAIFGSWGLIVGWNIAPPPPGPITLKSPGRGSLPPSRRANKAIRRKKETNVFFPLLSLLLFRLSFCQNCFALSILLSRHSSSPRSSFPELQQPTCIFKVDLLEYSIRQPKAVNPPAPL